jgi:hypothetical protein
MSVGAADKSKVESVSKTDLRKKKAPNRFNVSIVTLNCFRTRFKFYLLGKYV